MFHPTSMVSNFPQSGRQNAKTGRGVTLMIALLASTVMTTVSAFAQFDRPAAAAPPPVPAVLQPYSAVLDFVGRFGGLDLWAIKNGPVFAATPDGTRAIMGAAIDQVDGGLRDATPGYTGAPAVPVAKFLSSALGERFAAARRAEPTRQASVPTALVQPLSPASASQPSPPQPVLQAAPRSQEVETTPAASENRVIVTSAADARETIARALGVALNDPKVDEMMAKAGVRDVAAPAPAASPAVSSAVKPGERAGEILDRALYDVAHRGSWIAAGAGAQKANVPVVYAFIDPMCPHCAASIARLKPALDQGRLALRVLLTPYLSRDSFGVSAAIMRSSDPGGALIKHEVAKATNQPGLAPLDPEGKHADGSTNLNPRDFAAIQRNIDIFSQENLTGTPFWIWREKNGVRAVYGEVQANAFDQAMPDPGAGVDLAFSPTVTATPQTKDQVKP